jgi:sarcosine oxidase subunit alpha
MEDYRIVEHPIVDFKRGRKVSFTYNGRRFEAYEGESILAGLYAAGFRVFATSPQGDRLRGAFCMIGRCSSCLSRVNGVPNTRICIEPVRDGLIVETQEGLPDIPKVSREIVDVVEEIKDVDVLIIGAGPAGLKAAEILGGYGLRVLVATDHFRAGGQLVKQTHKFFGDTTYYGGVRGFKIAEKLISNLSRNPNVEISTRTFVYGYFKEGFYGAEKIGDPSLHLLIRAKYVIVASGASEKSLLFENNDLPGIMGAGGAQTLMNEYGVKPGEDALVIGSGNVGLIVAYQLLQAGVRVHGIAEVLREIGGWFVHAAKIRRHGVPIFTGHTIVRAEGRDRVEKAVISQVGKDLKPLPGTEKEFNVDLVLLAVGLQPNYSLLSQMGALMKYLPEAGGLIPLRTRYMETSIRNVFVAGDLSGIEEATTAFIEGEVAAYTILEREGFAKAVEERERILNYLWNEYRQSPVVQRSRDAKLKVTVSEEEMKRLRG